MFHQPPRSAARIPNRKKIHQHHESKKWTRLPVNEKCLECFPVPKPFLDTAFGKTPPEIRERIFKDVLKVGSLMPLKDGISVPMAKHQPGPRLELQGGPAGPASCLALLQTCRQIYHETSFLFYTLNTLHLSNPQDMLLFLRNLGTEVCGEIRSLHLEDMLVQVPQFSQGMLESVRSRHGCTEDTLARFASLRYDRIHPDVEKAVQLLNKRGNLRKLYLHMRPSQTREYIKLCTQVPGFRNREIVFASPTRWSVMAPSNWGERPWYRTFVDDATKTSVHDKNYYAYWGGNEKYRVAVDILPVSSEGRIADGASLDNGRSVNGDIGGGSSVHTAMEGLSLS